ncbi:MAG: hypothetical protein ACSLFI_07700 [Solirubrobacterales bacterium]
MWNPNYVQHPIGVVPPMNFDRLVSTVGLTSVTIGDVLVLDFSTASALSRDAGSPNSVWGRVTQATSVSAGSVPACVALESYTASAKTQIRVRFSGIVQAKIHKLTGSGVQLNELALILNSGGGTPGRALVNNNAPTVPSARRAFLLQDTGLADTNSGVFTVLFNGFQM